MSYRVLHIASDDLWGGAEVQVSQQVKALREREIDAQVLVFNDGDLKRYCEHQSIPCTLVSEAQGFIRFFRNCLSAVRAQSAQIVVSHGYKEAIVALVVHLYLQVAWISVFHGSSEAYTGLRQLKAVFYQFIARLSSRVFSNRILVVSNSLKKDLHFANLEKVDVVFNTTDSCETGEGSSLTNLHHPAVAIVGRLVAVKDITTALLCFEQLCDLARENALEEPHLYVIGEGPEQDRLQALRKSLRCSSAVSFLGFQCAAVRYIATADALLISSLSEGIPTVLLEALAHRTPVVASNVGGIGEVRDIVGEQVVRLVPPGDVIGFSQALFDLLYKKQGELFNEKTTAAMAKHFSPTASAKKLGEIYQKVLAG